LCPNANPPDPSCRGEKNVPGQGCHGQGECTLKIAWQGMFGGGGDLGSDPCPFSVKDVVEVSYACSTGGSRKPTSGAPYNARMGCNPTVMAEPRLSCP
jgi:hypothetical protein